MESVSETDLRPGIYYTVFNVQMSGFGSLVATPSIWVDPLDHEPTDTEAEELKRAYREQFTEVGIQCPNLEIRRILLRLDPAKVASMAAKDVHRVPDRLQVVFISYKTKLPRVTVMATTYDPSSEYDTCYRNGKILADDLTKANKSVRLDVDDYEFGILKPDGDVDYIYSAVI
jgi:hypothetical protein